MNAVVEVRGAAHDLHAGAFGGAVFNPAECLAGLVASLHDPSGRVAVEGFYDDVIPLSHEERRRLAKTGPSDTVLLAAAAASSPAGEPGYTAFERATLRPAIVVTNVQTAGSGLTAVPSRGSAALSIRLVPAQRPAAIVAGLRRHLAARLRPSVHARLHVRSSCPAYTLPPDSSNIGAVNRACRRVFGRPPLLLPSGGSIPFVSALAGLDSKPDVLLLGFGLPDDGMHAPNERMYLPNLLNGVAVCAELYAELGTETIRTPRMKRWTGEQQTRRP